MDDPYSFTNPDGRLNYVYYLTFSNYRIGSFIRPAFIFDEPGAFATIIGLWVLLAYSLKKFDGIVLAITALGLITQKFGIANICGDNASCNLGRERLLLHPWSLVFSDWYT